MHRASNAGAARWCSGPGALRDTDGSRRRLACRHNRLYTESGPGGKTWRTAGLIERRTATAWHQERAVSPSINVLNTRAAVAGEHWIFFALAPYTELLNVPDDEPWATGAAP